MNGIRNDASASRPLEGLVVVAIEQALAAPLCTGRLAEMGARVIKVERAEGDFARGYDDAANGQASYFVWTNRGKESIVLDFKNTEDAELLHRMLAGADVFVQNLAPGALARAGFGSDSLRERYPRLITCDISGYGTDNEASNLKAYDLLVQCESGLAGISGAPDACGRIGVSICDIGAGMNATIAVLSALALRERTGRGSGVSVSLFDGAADWMSIPYLHEVYGKGAPKRLGLKHPSIAPYGAFTTRDANDIVISIQNEREWQQFCVRFMRRPELGTDPRFASNTERVRHREALDRIIADAFATIDVDEALARLADSNTAYGQVRSVAQMARHPALRTWPMAVGGGALQMIAPAVQAPWDAGHFASAPGLGEHSELLRAEFSMARLGVVA
ncbi:MULTISPECIES: CaiB/BaiF CoA transferase family protein [Burkholderia]|uniref:CaiB/BaiF CoA transferase family protein n=1 Tax=Burkholderia TaxID=32008 RepID=UPI0005062BDA|nr:CaiB/BaiF CoA-transferase family protein [Burkholderia pyrrocinia]EKS9883421.1 CoA transferase [Burkholderia pyrrocinia]EKS9893117.1 CoA transferase [Burkholderia pyrrocinia]EKS9908891.1 CoA transferase [Burkholderia pyrrocinia]KFL54068.1 carnitine dehydratase [Burkholderia pyrrocinia]TDA48459.1 CoA transferase [Burkholderia pyrrocinia]